MKHILEIIGDALIIYFGITVLLIFIPVVIYDKYYIYEDIGWVLWTEITVAGLIILFGIYHLIKDLKQ